MAGCYGNSQEDRYYERMLDKYLDEGEKQVEWIEKRKEELLKDEYSLTHDNIMEALCNLPDHHAKVLTAYIETYNKARQNLDSYKDFADYIVTIVEKYLDDAADKQAVEDWENQ